MSVNSSFLHSEFLQYTSIQKIHIKDISLIHVTVVLRISTKFRGRQRRKLPELVQNM